MSRIDDLIAQHCPDGVEFKSIADIARRNKGIQVTAAQMKARHVDGAPIRVFAAGNTVAQLREEDVPVARVVRLPSIIVKSRGHIGFAFHEGPFTHKSEMWSYTFDPAVADSRFMYHYLLTRAPELQEWARATSVKLPQLSVGDTDRLKVPVPPLAIQREIASILDKMESLKAELEAELEYRSRQYEFYRDQLLAFDGVEGVRWVTMGEVGEFTRGRRFTKADVVENGIPCINFGEIYTRYGVFAHEVYSRVRAELRSSLRFARTGDVIVTGVSETVEDIAKAVAWLGEEDVAVHDDCFAYRHSLDPKFVSYYLQTGMFHAEKAKHVARAKVKRISSESLARLTIPVPSPEEQQRIVSILDQFDALVNDLSIGLPAEIAARQKQYEYYRDKLLTFPEREAS